MLIAVYPSKNVGTSGVSAQDVCTWTVGMPDAEITEASNTNIAETSHAMDIEDCPLDAVSLEKAMRLQKGKKYIAGTVSLRQLTT